MPRTPAFPIDPTQYAGPSFRAHFDATAAERATLTPRDLMHVNLDIPLAVSTCLGALPAITALIPQIRHHLPTADADRLARIDVYAGALAHAHARYLAATSPALPLDAINARALAARDALLGDATALARRGLIPSDRLPALRVGTGYRKTAFDLLAVADLFRTHWARIENSTPVTLDELAAADALANELLLIVARRDHAVVEASEAALERQRAYTLFVRLYDELRRAATYLRWHTADEDTIVPSLYIRRRPARRNDAPPAAAPAAPAAPEPAPQPASPDASPDDPSDDDET